MSQPLKSSGQPPIFWISLALGLIAVTFGVIRVSMLGERGGAIAIGLILALVITLLVIGGFALSTIGRMRGVAARLPHAIRIPIVVSGDLASAIGELGDGSLKLKPSSYAAIAVDQDGIHLVANGRGAYSLVPAQRVSVAGLGRTLLGTREMTSLLLRVSTDSGDIDLPIVPMRLRGNPIRQLTPQQFEQLSTDLSSALAGRPITEPGWPY